MKIYFRRIPSGMVLVALFFLFSACGAGNQAGYTPEGLYRQASLFSRNREYLKALDCYSRAIALDTLQVNSPRMVQALYQKMSLEGLTGEYYEALKTSARLEKLPAGALPDSLHERLFSDKADLLRELGNFSAAAASLEKIVSPSQELLFDRAIVYLESGDYGKAAAIYRRYTGTERDPAIRMTAYAALLQCKVAQPELDGESAEAISGKIAAESKRVFASEGELIPRIQALRAASKTLQLLEKQRRNASFLLFRALVLAEKSQNQFLVQVLRQESNAVIVRKADAFREAADYFRINNLQYAQAASLFMLAESKTLKAEERITALQQGFNLCSDFAPPYPAEELLELEKSAGRRLRGLLMEKTRIFELFDAEEKNGSISLKRTLQRYPDSFKLGKGHEALEVKVRQLQHEMAGLLQRKANIVVHAEGVEKSRQVDRALNIKRGKMLELLAEVKVINPAAADILQFIPVTLRTVQSALKEDQLIIKPLLCDSLCGVMLIGKRQLQITGSSLFFDAQHNPEAALRNIRAELASTGTRTPFPDTEVEWFTKAFYEPVAGSLSGFRHLVVIADDLLPYHMFGRSLLVPPVQRYSSLQSLKEFVLLSEERASLPASSMISFYRPDNLSGARLQKLFAPRDRIFLLWKNFPSREIEAWRERIGKEMLGTISGSEALFILHKKSEIERNDLMYISSFGVD
ncbi:MAG: hypothetical protein WCI64_07150 [Chlorobium sp.]